MLQISHITLTEITVMVDLAYLVHVYLSLDVFPVKSNCMTVLRHISLLMSSVSCWRTQRDANQTNTVHS